MSITSLSTGSSPDSSCPNSPISQCPQYPQYSLFPAPQERRRKPLPETRRYYSTPLNGDSPDSTPLHLYGLEQRRSSIAVSRKPTQLDRPNRLSRALDDIVEDYSMQLDAGIEEDRIRSERQWTGMYDTSSPSRPSSRASGIYEMRLPSSSSSSRPSHSRRSSILFFDNWSPPTRTMTKRLSRFGFLSKRKTVGTQKGASISQPNLIGSSNLV